MLKKLWTAAAYDRDCNFVAPLWAIALALGLIQGWANRFYMGNDGVSYLDMADAYLRGDWHTAINSSWNPLYAWLIGVDFSIFHPSPYWEYPSVQLLNFAIYVATVAGFEYFLRSFLAGKREDKLAIRVIAYALFVWASLFLTRVWTVNADMLVAACLFTAMGILLRPQNQATDSLVTPIALGVTLAAGYYSKAVMLPLSIALLLFACVLFRWRRALIAAIALGMLSIPFVVSVSKATGHLTFSDTGRVNYAWYVNGVQSRWWQGGPPEAGRPLHPPRVALDSPRVYEFGGVFPQVTYPIWYDFAYWYQGLVVRVHLRGLARLARKNLIGIMKVLALQGGGFWLGWGFCLILYDSKGGVLKELTGFWPVWGVSVAEILLYGSIHAEPRYLGACAVMLPLSAFAALRIQGKTLAIGVASFGLLWSLCFCRITTWEGPVYVPWEYTKSNASWQVAMNLQGLGLRRNDKVASVCYSNRNNVIWARLAGVHIVAETDWNVDFWSLSGGDQDRVLSALARSGAVMAVSDESPPIPPRALGWQQAGNTRYYAYSLTHLLVQDQRIAIPEQAGPDPRGQRLIPLVGTR